MNKNLLPMAILNSLGVAAYIVIVALILQNSEKLFGQGNSITTIIAGLLLMVLSAAIVGALIFTKPVMLYLDGAKKESIKLLLYTLILLFFYTLLYLVILALI